MLITRYSQPVRRNGYHADSLRQPDRHPVKFALRLEEWRVGLSCMVPKYMYVSVYAPRKVADINFPHVLKRGGDWNS